MKITVDGETIRMIAPSRLYLRRAVLRVLLDAGGPLRIPEIVERLAAEGWGEEACFGPPNKVVSDILRHQVSQGRVARVARGVYRVRPDRISRSTLWRIRNHRDYPVQV